MMKFFLNSLAAVFFLGFIACETKTTTSEKEDTTSIEKKSILKNLNADEFNSTLNGTKNPVIIDVRSAEEIAETGIIAGAKNIDVNSSNFANEISALDKSKITFVYCRSGRRSSAAALQLQTMGFGEIYNLDGGILSWLEKGLPLTK